MATAYFNRVYARNHTAMPGVGVIHSQTVGNTSHTTGHDHHFLAEGAKEAVSGSVRFSAFVGENGEIAWRFAGAMGPKTQWRQHLDEASQPDFPPEAVAKMRRLSETLHEHAGNDWFFSALGAVETELATLERRGEDLASTIRTLSRLLADPAEPRAHFVSAAECGQPKGFNRPATNAERAERRAAWTKRLDAQRDAAATFTATTSKRLALLRRLRQALRDWSHASHGRGTAFDAYRAAIAG